MFDSMFHICVENNNANDILLKKLLIVLLVKRYQFTMVVQILEISLI